MTIKFTSQPQQSGHPQDEELEVLLPNDDYRLAHRRGGHRGRIWLLPAILFLLALCFFKFMPFQFGGDWRLESRKLSLDINYTDVLMFRQEGKGNIYGTLEIFETSPGEQPKLEVDVFTFTSDADGADSVYVETYGPGGEIVLRCDRGGLMPIKIEGRLHICVDKLKELSVSTRSLDMNLNVPNIDLLKSSFYSASGSLKSRNYFKSRDIVVDLVSGQISGQYSLYDSLRLSTKSGDIHVEVTPEEGSLTALTQMSTLSGSSRVRFMDFVKGRRYETWVESASGQVHGKFLLGDKLSVKATSGEIKIEAIGTGAKSSNLKTENTSGDTKVTIDEQLDAVIQGFHSTVSGQVKLNYPSLWEGSIHAKAISGDIKLKGEGVEIVGDSKSPVGKEISGIKGDISKAELTAQSISGGIKIAIGK